MGEALPIATCDAFLMHSTSIVSCEHEMELGRQVERIAVEFSLTEGETKVLRLIVRGDANKEIAAVLRSSLRTIEVHVSSLFKKMGVESRTRLVASFWIKVHFGSAPANSGTRASEAVR